MKRIRILAVILIISCAFATSCSEQNEDYQRPTSNVLTIDQRDLSDLPDDHPLKNTGKRWSTEDDSLWFIINEDVSQNEADDGEFVFYGGLNTEEGSYDIRVVMSVRQNALIIAERNDAEFDNSLAFGFTYTKDKMELRTAEGWELDFEPMKEGFDTVTMYSEPYNE